jgi:hypothetical protein
MNPDKQPQFNKPVASNLDIGQSESEGNLSAEQKAGIKFSIEIGKQIKQSCPEIAMDYINGASTAELVVKYDILKRFNVENMSTAQRAVGNALKGYSGTFGLSYPGLIKDPEIIKTIGKKHQKQAGEFSRDRGLGVFGMSEEQKKQVGSRSGMVLYQTRKGIHAQSAEERSRIGKMAVISKGFIPLSKEAEAFIRGLDLNSTEYAMGKKVNAKKIAEEVNTKFYDGKDVIRTGAISSFVRRMRKKSSPEKE